MALDTNTYCRNNYVKVMPGHGNSVFRVCVRQDYMNVYASVGGLLTVNQMPITLWLERYTNGKWNIISSARFGIKDGQTINHTFKNIAVKDAAMRVRVMIDIQRDIYAYSTQFWR